MHRARRVPAAREDEKANEEIEQANDAQIIFDRGGSLRRLGDQQGLKLFPAPFDSVVRLRPQPNMPQAFSNLDGIADREVIDGDYFIVGSDSRIACRRVL